MNIKILVADDDMDNRTIAAETLESSGYDVVLACNGLEAIELAVSERPRVILMDLSMPKLTVADVSRLKAMPGICDIPVIAFTAHAMTGDDRKAKLAGCNDYLTKPCEPKTMLKKVNEWCGL